MLRVQFFTPIEFDNFINSVISGTDTDIDKVQYRIPNEIDNSPEAVAYRRIRAIANTNTNSVNWAVAIKDVTEDINTISNLIRSNKLKYPKELKEFVENCIAIFDYWDKHYRDDFNLIKEYRDSLNSSASISSIDFSFG